MANSGAMISSNLPPARSDREGWGGSNGQSAKKKRLIKEKWPDREKERKMEDGARGSNLFPGQGGVGSA